jgi:hypothetical protein
MSIAGFRVVFPVALIYLAVVVVPFGVAVAWLLRALETRAVQSPIVGLAIGSALLTLYLPDRAWFVLGAAAGCLALVVQAARHRTPTTRRVVVGLLTIAAIYVAVWNGNYLALLLNRGRIHDDALRVTDLWIYRSLINPNVDYTGVFPLTHRPWLLAALERGYLVLFGELAIALFVLIDRPDSLRRFLLRLATCYAVGLLWFVAWPVAGPYLMFPESINASVIGASTRAIMDASRDEFSAIRAGGQPINGFGYFVGLPSLHVAMATLLQITIGRASRIGGWIVAPMNALMAVSTVFLGYHYVADAAAGVLVAVLSVAATAPFQDEASTHNA